MRKLFVILIPLLFIIGSQYSCQESNINFSDQIKPLLNEKCVACHGGVKKAGGLSLLSREAALEKNEKSGHAAIVPGSAKQSELFKRIQSNDPEYRMPRGEEHTLEDHEVKVLEEWINEGAKWDTHWAYFPLRQFSIPSIEDNWAETAIDKYVFKKHQELDFTHSVASNKLELWRRASLDLTGVPVFEKGLDLDYEEYLDQLLSSSFYGEHWASMWLDLARYADSKGYEKDLHRNIWRYRDWVINAFNQDMPFDQFTIDQLAGDLVNPNDYDKLIATSFNRNSMTNTEGGTDDEEFRVAAVIDRLNTTFEIWQSTPIGCAQCHDHPYDPISQIEFYESMSLFNNTVDADLTSEYPFYESYPEDISEEIDDIIAFIVKQEDKSIDNSLPQTEKIKKALHPILMTYDIDDFENILLFPNGVINNWTNNVNDMKGRQFYFMYEKVDFDRLDSIRMTHASSGDISYVEARIDSKGGELLFKTNFEKTNSKSGHEWAGEHDWIKTSIDIPSHINGKHDLIFEIQNPELIVPDGILHFKEIELIYQNTSPTPELLEKKLELISLRKQAERTPILRQKSNKLNRTHQLFVRGNHAMRADTVVEGIPGILNSNEDIVSNRLELAKWLVNENNPLTARVMVNRIWERLFGIGIVETLEDFGSKGDLPTNQELLDYLAYEFIHTHKWSIKSLIKEIMLSNTYRQSSELSDDMLARDPYNAYLTRGPRIRLSSEQIRDQALFVSELLYDTIGGMSVMPPQPVDVWQTVYNNQKWKESKGKHKYRRGLYTYWKRSSPYPSMETFDSPSREFCKSRRIRTNTPTQALVTLNDPVYIEAANAMSVLMQDHSAEPSKQIQFAYQKALGRPATESIHKNLELLFSQAQEKLDQSTSESEFQSASAVVAHAIFNLDAFLNKT